MLTDGAHLFLEIAKGDVHPFFVGRQRKAQRSNRQTVETTRKARIEVTA
jgi:hypothetical protein